MRVSGHLWTLLVVAAVLALLGAGAWYGLHFVPYDVVYEVEADFVEVPPTDAELGAWLAGQPGVWRAFVQRERGAGRCKVTVILGMTRDGWGPEFPDLDAKSAELGYRGPAGPFRDTDRRRR